MRAFDHLLDSNDERIRTPEPLDMLDVTKDSTDALPAPSVDVTHLDDVLPLLEPLGSELGS